MPQRRPLRPARIGRPHTFASRRMAVLRTQSTYLKKAQPPLIALMLLAGAAVAGGGEPAGENWHRDWQSAWRDSQAQNRPMVLFVTMEHCHYCDKMSRETYGDASVIDDLASGFVPASINSDTHPNLMRKLNVDVFPTTVIMGSDAKVIDSMTGYVGPEQLRRRLKAAGAKAAGAKVARR